MDGRVVRRLVVSIPITLVGGWLVKNSVYFNVLCAHARMYNNKNNAELANKEKANSKRFHFRSPTVFFFFIQIRFFRRSNFQPARARTQCHETPMTLGACDECAVLCHRSLPSSEKTTSDARARIDYIMRTGIIILRRGSRYRHITNV